MLWTIYCLGAGYILGQLCAHQRPPQLKPLPWSLAIIAATILWPPFMAYATIIPISRLIQAFRQRKSG